MNMGNMGRMEKMVNMLKMVNMVKFSSFIDDVELFLDNTDNFCCFYEIRQLLIILTAISLVSPQFWMLAPSIKLLTISTF